MSKYVHITAEFPAVIIVFFNQLYYGIHHPWPILNFDGGPQLDHWREECEP